MIEQPKRKSVTQLPLISECQASLPSNSNLTELGVAPTLMMQLESLGGEIYQMPLSVRAARGLLLALAAWEPISESMKETDDPQTPKGQ